tara:strand:+ start:433 stop:801 length:369 start_codon:yes stop_codon:yes gene_type:complete
MNDNKKEKLDFDQRDLTVETALYVMAVGAVLADGVVEDDELGVVCDIADMFGHEAYFDDAILYHEHFKDNTKAMKGAVTLIKKSSEAAKIGAVAFMSYVLVQDGVNQSESDFYDMVVTELLA